MVASLLSGEPCTPDTCSHKKPTIIRDLDEIVRLLKLTPVVSTDAETTSFNPFTGRVECFSYCFADDLAAWLPFIGSCAVPVGLAVEKLSPIYQDPDRIWIEHNGKFDNKWKTRMGLRPRGKIIDTCIASRMLDENLDSQSLKDLIPYFFKHRMVSYKEIKKLRTPQQNLFLSQDQVEKEFAGYSVEDSVWTWRLWFHNLEPKMRAEPRLYRLFTDLECRVSRALEDMELRGVFIDLGYLDKLDAYFEERLKGLEAEAYKLAGRKFNIASPDEVASLLFDELGLPIRGDIRRTADGSRYSVDAGVLGRYTDIPLPGKIVEVKKTQKLRSTYTHPLGELAKEIDGRIRSTFNQVPSDHDSGQSAVTGRLSSSGPNLQNIPIRSEEGRKIRTAFAAPEGRSLIVFDYSQIELRFLAHYSQDKALMRAYCHWDCAECKASGSTNKALHACPKCGAPDGKRDKLNPKQPPIKGFCLGLDLHTITAGKCGVSRDEGKVINFALDFGMGLKKFAIAINKPINKARKIRDAYFETYKGLDPFFDSVCEDLSENGYVTTILGRKRRFPECKFVEVEKFSREWRQATNARIQGSAADLMKVGLRNTYEGFCEKGWDEDTYGVLTVHDEYVVETDTDKVAEVMPYVREKMENAFEISVPILTSVGTGQNWGNAKG